MASVENGGVRIAYRERGDGQPVLLIHGWSGEGRYWEEFGYVGALRAAFRTVLPDLRGHGESGFPASRDFSIPAYTSDALAVLDGLDIRSAHVLGYSLGGWVAFELAARFPARVRSVIVGGAHPYAESLAAIRTAFTPTAIRDAWESLGAPLSDDSRRRLVSIDPALLAELVPPDPVDQSERLLTLPMPFLLFCGTEDWRFEEMRRFAASHGRAKFVSLKGLDHLGAWQRADLVLPPLLDFLHAAS